MKLKLKMGKDKISKEKRSHIMSCIKSKNTKIELKIRKALWCKNYRYRLHFKLLGSPDIVFTRQKVVVFIDGDFWHGYNFRGLRPKLKNDFWIKKITRNMQRDKQVNSELNSKGWKVLRFWEHEINDNLDECTNKIRGNL